MDDCGRHGGSSGVPVAGNPIRRARQRLSANLLVRLRIFQPHFPGKGKTDRRARFTSRIFRLAEYFSGVAAGHRGWDFRLCAVYHFDFRNDEKMRLAMIG